MAAYKKNNIPLHYAGVSGTTNVVPSEAATDDGAAVESREITIKLRLHDPVFPGSHLISMQLYFGLCAFISSDLSAFASLLKRLFLELYLNTKLLRVDTEINMTS